MNWTAPQMMLTIKLTGSAFEYYDGNSKPGSLSPLQQERAFTAMPSLLQWMGYCFFFPTLLVGPPCGLKEYLAFTDRSMFKDESGGRIPSCLTWPGLGRKLAMGILAMTYHFLAVRYNVMFATTVAFQSYSYLYRLFYVIIATEISFEHYYFGWSCAEGACVMAGLAYNGRDSKTKQVLWNRVDMIDLWAMRSAQNGAVVGRAWNVLGARWLRSTVYTRLCARSSSPQRKTAAMFATFLTSALWHGFYPGFYLSFLSFAYLNIVSQMSTKLIRPIFISPDGQRKSPLKPFYDALTWLTTQTCFYYCANPFKMMSVRNTLATWSAVYFTHHVVGTLLLVVYFVFGSTFRRLHMDRQTEQVKIKTT